MSLDRGCVDEFIDARAHRDLPCNRRAKLLAQMTIKYTASSDGKLLPSRLGFLAPPHRTSTSAKSTSVWSNRIRQPHIGFEPSNFLSDKNNTKTKFSVCPLPPVPLACQSRLAVEAYSAHARAGCTWTD